MTRLYLGLSSTEGDRLGHLVRGVQMLRSYGSEVDVESYSDVFDLALIPEEPPALACVVSGESDASLEALKGICRETEWALGDEPEILSVWLLQFGGQRRGGNPPGLEAIHAGTIGQGMTLALPGDEFRQLCDWGQVMIGEEGGVIGEWPSATGR